MYQFFVEEGQIAEDGIHIDGGDHNHIKNVLRMKPGERVRISTRSGRSFFGRVGRVCRDETIVEVEAEDVQGTELCSRITLFQGLPKGDKMELIIQKATELGAGEIVPVAMKNCVVRLDEKRAQSKQRRWQAIAESAAKQSKRTCIPCVRMPVAWNEALAEAGMLDVVLVPYENEKGMAGTREVIRSIPKGSSIGIMIGPEGGFAVSEIEGLLEGMHRISLGRRILRTETAGIAALAMLVYELED